MPVHLAETASWHTSQKYGKMLESVCKLYLLTDRELRNLQRQVQSIEQLKQIDKPVEASHVGEMRTVRYMLTWASRPNFQTQSALKYVMQRENGRDLRSTSHLFSVTYRRL